jgi:5-methylcytosine-specific restriction enzyme A
MPQAAPKPCGVCGVLVRDGTSRCAAHLRPPRYVDERRGSRHERGYGTAWDKLRKVALSRDAGLCVPCRDAGLVTLATAVDHVLPKALGGTDELSNLQAICHACHKAKSAREGRQVQRQVAREHRTGAAGTTAHDLGLG